MRCRGANSPTVNSDVKRAPKDLSQQQLKVRVRVCDDGKLETLDGAETRSRRGWICSIFPCYRPRCAGACWELAEPRAQRLKGVGGSVFKRARSPHWQIKYRMIDRARAMNQFLHRK